MKSVQLTSKSGIAVVCGVFVAGTVFGWYLKTWRQRWLAAKRDFFARKTLKAHEQLLGQTGSDGSELVVQS